MFKKIPICEKCGKHEAESFSFVADLPFYTSDKLACML